MSNWTEAYKILEKKKQLEEKQKQQAFYNTALMLAHRELVEERLIENALHAAAWVRKQQKKQPASNPRGNVATWLLPIG